MVSKLVRVLALHCGLLLLLPPGWCCLFAPFTKPAGHILANSKPACCGHCGSKREKPSAPLRDHVPARDGKCPCGERAATAFGCPANAGPDLMFPTPGAATRVDTAYLAGSTCEPPAACSAPSHFHLLNCVWLC